MVLKMDNNSEESNEDKKEIDYTMNKKDLFIFFIVVDISFCIFVFMDYFNIIKGIYMWRTDYYLMIGFIYIGIFLFKFIFPKTDNDN